MNKIMILTAAGVGYVLGARAGRERYAQIRSVAFRVRNDPFVQEKAHEAADLAREKVPGIKNKVSETAHAWKGEESPVRTRPAPQGVSCS